MGKTKQQIGYQMLTCTFIFCAIQALAAVGGKYASHRQALVKKHDSEAFAAFRFFDVSTHKWKVFCNFAP